MYSRALKSWNCFLLIIYHSSALLLPKLLQVSFYGVEHSLLCPILGICTGIFAWNYTGMLFVFQLPSSCQVKSFSTVQFRTSCKDTFSFFPACTEWCQSVLCWKTWGIRYCASGYRLDCSKTRPVMSQPYYIS